MAKTHFDNLPPKYYYKITPKAKPIKRAGVKSLPIKCRYFILSKVTAAITFEQAGCLAYA
jgi:hypothetical protein